MITIHLNGKAIRHSRNLRGLITHATRVGVESVHLEALSNAAGGAFVVTFRDGSTCNDRFASFAVMREFFTKRARRWGATLSA